MRLGCTGAYFGFATLQFILHLFADNLALQLHEENDYEEASEKRSLLSPEKSELTRIPRVNKVNCFGPVIGYSLSKQRNKHIII